MRAAKSSYEGFFFFFDRYMEFYFKTTIITTTKNKLEMISCFTMLFILSLLASMTIQLFFFFYICDRVNSPIIKKKKGKRSLLRKIFLV